MDTTTTMVTVAVAALILAYMGIKLFMERKNPKKSRRKNNHDHASDYNNSATDILD